MKEDFWSYRFAISFGIIAAMVVWNLSVLRTLWLDEAMLAINIFERSPLTLLVPLGYKQAAPIGYLYWAKFSGWIGGYGVLSLRIVSAVGFLVGWVGFYGGLRELLPNRRGWPELVGLFLGLTFTPLMYAVEVKQYTMDFMVWAWAFWGTVALLEGKLQTQNRKHFRGLCILGVAMIGLSNVAVLILLGVGLTWLVHLLRTPKRDELALWFRVVACWAGSFGVYYILFIHNHPSQDFMLRFWSRADAFMPLDDNPLGWIAASMVGLLQFSFNHFAPSALFHFAWAVAILGWVVLQKRSTFFLFLFIPICTHLLISSFGLYPFKDRLAIWHFPAFLVGWAAFLSFCVQTLNRPIVLKATTLFIVTAIAFNLNHTVKRMPVLKYDLRPQLQALAAEAGPEHLLYHTYSARPTLIYESLREPDFPDLTGAAIGDWNERPLELDLVMAHSTDTSYFLAYPGHMHLADSLKSWCQQNHRSFELIVNHAGSQLYRTVNNP